MDRSNSKNFSQLTRRTAALLCAALAGLSLGRGAAAQVVGPLTHSPAFPSPYQSPLFHSGGAVDPSTLGIPPFLYGQLQGTPTGSVTVGTTTIQTQIPSFLLGSYDPTKPPTGALNYYPEHFADGDNPPTNWAAPFVYSSPSAGTVSADDSDLAFNPPGPTVSSGFTQTGGWQQVTPALSNAAGTATNGEYLRVSSNSTNEVATWQLFESIAGSYAVYFNLPNDVPDVNGNTEIRSNQVTYAITVRDVNGLVTSTGNAIASQTESNSKQFLAGPFQVQTNGTVTVTLTCNKSSGINYNANTPYYIVADSMMLAKANGDVQSTPTAINYDSYPNDFKRIQYWGSYIQPTASVTSPPSQADGIIPDTTGGLTPSATPLLYYGDPTKPKNEFAAPDPRRRIRQVVYFGRIEPVFNRSVTIDDSGLGFGGGGALISSPSATNGEYRTNAAAVGPGLGSVIGNWSLNAPNPTGATPTNYFVSVHLPATPTGETRIGSAAYVVTRNGVPGFPTKNYGPVRISQVTGSVDVTVTLPTGPIPLAPGQQVVVGLYNKTVDNAPIKAGSVIVSDSVTLSTPPTRGAIYCVDGFTGGVIWRYETPSSVNGPSASVYSSPSVAKIHVLVAPADRVHNLPAVYADKLVVVVGDNNGLVYCLDAMGNGDGTSNSKVQDQDGQPIYIQQPPYVPIDPTTGQPATVDPTTGNAIPPLLKPGDPGYAPHVGTTSVYWIYRPNANLPKQVTGTGATVGKIKAVDTTSDVPVPAAFNTASATIYVDPNKSAINVPNANGIIPLPADNSAPSNAIVYVGNTNGVLYALDATGSGIDGQDLDSYNNSGDLAQTNPSLRNPGDKFNASLDLRQDPTVFPAQPTDSIVPTPQPLWWFSLRGQNPNASDVTTFADIESAPALYVAKTVVPVDATHPTGFDYAPTVYIGSAHEMESGSNVGRLYALNGLYGPSGDKGLDDPRNIDPKVISPPASAYGGPGAFDYNVAPRPTLPTVGGVIDTTDWSFPDAYGTQPKAINSSQKARPALGNVSGSPVVFTNAADFNGITHESNAALQTRIYFAANTGLEVPAGSANGTSPAARPSDTLTGRIWAVNLDGSVGTTTNSGAAVNASGSNVWSFPLANDPNNAAKDTVAEPNAPIGSFLHATPAIGYVQFPAQSDNAFTGAGASGPYTDVLHNGGTGVFGQSVPMLYVGTRGANDSGLYYIDIDGDATLGNPGTTRRLIYRQKSPNQTIFQCSPALITNPSSANGNGGSVFITSGNSFFDFSATPLSNFDTNENFRLVRENQEYFGMGPISSPIVAACDVSDLNTTSIYANPTPTFPSGPSYNVSDWVYVGDGLHGICRGFTPRDTTDSAIPTDLNAIVPTPYDPITPVDLTVSMQAYLVAETNKDSRSSTSALSIGLGSALPVYEWGQNVYIRFANVVPPISAGSGNVYILYDHTLTPTAANPVTAYGNGGPIEFDLSDATPNSDGSAASPPDHAIIPATYIAAPAALQPLPNGFYTQSSPAPLENLQSVDPANAQYIGAYTYTIADGSARLNTPGSRRQILNAHQTVEVYTYDGATVTDQNRTTQITAFISDGNKVSKPIRNAAGVITGYDPTLTKVAGEDQPTFGILNPLAIRGGGVNLLDPNKPAVQVGDELGPFRGVIATLSNQQIDLQALANGNDIPTAAPPSSAGGKGAVNPEQPLDLAPAAFNPPTTPKVVVTSTGLIPHNTDGDNIDPINSLSNTPLPQGTYNAGTDGLSALNFGTSAMPYAANVSDRGALSLLGQQIRVKAGTDSGGNGALFWNDNSNIPHGSVVNYLPWEISPDGTHYGNGVTNPSADYPDISASHLSATVYRPDFTLPFNSLYVGAPEDLTLGQGYLYPSKISGNSATAVQNRTVYVNPLQFHISIPHWQPANQQVFQKLTSAAPYANGAEITPVNTATGASNIASGDVVFPMGYVTNRRIYVPGPNGFYREGAAYRYIRVYTGVPPDYGLQMHDATVDLGGVVPSGFGIQTSSFPGLIDSNGVKTFDPYNLLFQDYFQPLTIYNTGNTNLLNVHLDQKLTFSGSPDTLEFVSDASDPLSFLAGYDLNGATGPRTGTYGASNVPEEHTILRSSLDMDMVTAYGHTPNVPTAFYPSSTFHKARVGSSNPSTLSLPDGPETFDPKYSLQDSPTGKPIVPSGSGIYKSLPYVSIAVPFGTVAGSYHGTLQAFEGIDIGGYNTYKGSGQLFDQSTRMLYPPHYGKAIGGIGAPVTDLNGILQDETGTASADIVKFGGSRRNPIASLMPISTTGTVLNFKVVEDRMTDGFTYGSVPMIDAGPAVPAAGAVPAHATPDFGPAAFRDYTTGSSTGNISLYWTTGRSNSGFGIQAANVAMNQTPAVPGGVPYFTTIPSGQFWWSQPTLTLPAGTNSGLTIAQDDANNPASVYAFAVNVNTPPYANTLYSYAVAPGSGLLSSPLPVTSDPSQVKYGVKGLSCKSAGFTRNLWAFWTATTRGRTSIYYNSLDPANSTWLPTTGPSTTALLPVPAGLTSVADPAPVIIGAIGTVNGVTGPGQFIDVTYSGTGPDGNVDLYESRYHPDSNAASAFTLDLIPFPDVTEILKPSGQPGGWYQARDVAWSRTGALNLLVKSGTTAPVQILYDTTVIPAKPLFTRAVFDKASGLLVLTGVSIPNEVPDAANTTLHTVYIDYATGRVRFSPALRTTVAPGLKTFEVRALFDPLARRITTDSRADTSPITFLDDSLKANETGPPSNPPSNGTLANAESASRRWYIWRKSGTGGAAPSATLYYKTQRLTAFLPRPIQLNAFGQPANLTITVNAVSVYDSTAVNGGTSQNAVDVDAARGRVYFQINEVSGLTEGQTFSVTYTDIDNTVQTVTDTIQWQDEEHSNVNPTPTDTATGLNSVFDTIVPISGPINEDNVSAFLDPSVYSNTNSATEIGAGRGAPHKVWLFWNSTRNGTADIYYETINPLFAAGP